MAYGEDILSVGGVETVWWMLRMLRMFSLVIEFELEFDVWSFVQLNK